MLKNLKKLDRVYICTKVLIELPHNVVHISSTFYLNSHFIVPGPHTLNEVENVRMLLGKGNNVLHVFRRLQKVQR